MTGDVSNYHRSYLPVTRYPDPLEAKVAETFLGNELEISLGGIQICGGIVTDVRVAKGRLMVVVESGGRMCGVCRHLWSEEDAAAGQLIPAGAAPAADPGVLDQQTEPWTPVCQDRQACARRSGEQAATG